MKRELYSLTDEEFAYFTDRLHNVMESHEVPYIMVGGTANQAHILKRLCEQNDDTLTELVSDPKVRLQDYIRATDDVDIAVDSSIVQGEGEKGFARRLSSVLNQVAVDEVISPSEEYIFGYSLLREGVKRPKFQVFVDGETSEKGVISMNVGRHKSDLENLESENYDTFVNQGEVLHIPYDDDFDIRMRVIKPQHLLAAKISKFRPKDTFDVRCLADIMRERGEDIGLPEIEELLLPDYGENYLKFLSLADLEDPHSQ